MNSELPNKTPTSGSHHIKILKAIIIVLIFSALIIIIVYEYRRYKSRVNSCKNIDSIYLNKLAINTNSCVKNLKLNQVAIMGSFNSCATDNLCNSYVNLCALKLWIKQGIRAFDFEIYSVNNQPVVAVSNDDSFCLKTSYNHLAFKDVMNTLKTYALKSTPDGAANYNDPLFINLRVKSAVDQVYTSIAQTLKICFNPYLLPSTYKVDPKIFTGTYDANLMPILTKPISALNGKVIIMFDMTTPIKINIDMSKKYPDLANLINIYIPLARLNQLDKLAKSNHITFKAVIPDYNCSSINITSSNENISITDTQLNIAFMNFQSHDSNLISYISRFKDKHDTYHSIIPLTDWSATKSNPLDGQNCPVSQYANSMFANY